jgi:hypothetical protein
MQVWLPAAVSLVSLMVVTHLMGQVMPRHSIQSGSKTINFTTDVNETTLQDLDCHLFSKMFFQKYW